MDESKPDVIEVPTPAPAADVEVLPNGSEPAKLDPNFYYLSVPIEVEGRKLDRLRINPRGVLSGRNYFDLVAQFQRKFPDDARNVVTESASKNYLSMVIAKLNKIAPEDLYKCDYGDMTVLFLQCQTFHFGTGASLQTITAASPEP
jgi:hypothetical protein